MWMEESVGRETPSRWRKDRQQGEQEDGVRELQTGGNLAGGPQHLFPRATPTKCHHPGDLEQQLPVLSWFWRLQVQNQDVGMALLSLKALREDPSSFFQWVPAILGIPWPVRA